MMNSASSMGRLFILRQFLKKLAINADQFSNVRDLSVWSFLFYPSKASIMFVLISQELRTPKKTLCSGSFEDKKSFDCWRTDFSFSTDHFFFFLAKPGKQKTC